MENITYKIFIENNNAYIQNPAKFGNIATRFITNRFAFKIVINIRNVLFLLPIDSNNYNKINFKIETLCFI